MRTHKDLEVWKKSVELVTSIYKLTSNFPREEMFGLTNQIRRSAVSVPSNIAEGAARQSAKEFVHFLSISLGSQQELETQLLISKNLTFMTETEYLNIICEVETVGKLLNGLIKSIKTKEL
ncbi:four helix bundle protein [Haoranjiania flava]|uniref:Four helix bundle protein n=1 Tax=Haoranjiania flava TaxID=1856322 RepID=A0AAE3LKI9_9BACT|nr:four helix bundle protein [Haoranjiania flava]MCU7694618.1 four helix bundle protein [Haoranjiania flava]